MTDTVLNFHFVNAREILLFHDMVINYKSMNFQERSSTISYETNYSFQGEVLKL